MNNKNPKCNLCLSEVRLIFKSKILNKYDCTNFIKNSHTYLLNGETFKFDLVYPGISKGEFKNKIRYDVSVTVYK